MILFFIFQQADTIRVYSRVSHITSIYKKLHNTVRNAKAFCCEEVNNNFCVLAIIDKCILIRDKVKVIVLILKFKVENTHYF